MTDLRVVNVDDPYLRDQLLDALTASPVRGVFSAGVVNVVADDVADAVLAVLRECRPAVEEHAVKMHEGRLAVGTEHEVRRSAAAQRRPQHHRYVTEWEAAP